VEDEDQMQVDDTPIPSFILEPPPDSTPEVMDEDDNIPTMTIMIVKEEELDGNLASYKIENELTRV
jgi:hypothetical protein